MNQIEDLPPSELERSLPDRLHRSAAGMSPAPGALAEVRARAAGRRRRTRVAVMVSSAAAVALIAAGVVVVTGDEPSTGLTAGPAEGSAPSTTVAPVPAPDGDATLVIYRYPNATSEMIAQDPKMGGEWAELNLADRTCHANGPLGELGGDSPCAASNLGAMLERIDAGASAEELQLEVSNLVVDDLLRLLASGWADAQQVERIVAILETQPGVLVSSADGGATVSVSRQDPAIGDTVVVTIDATTGRPLRRGWLGDPALDIEYLSVTRVRAADHLIPGRGTPSDVSTTTTSIAGALTTTTSVVGDDAGDQG